MAKYKLLTQKGWSNRFEIDKIYDECAKIGTIFIKDCIKSFPNDWELVEDRKIIGYKAPCDIFSIEVKSGEICTKSSTGNEYVFKNHNYLPKEIVELWEPVYEIKSTYPDVTINGHKGEFFENYVRFGCAKIDRSFVLSIHQLMQLYNESDLYKGLTSVAIGKGIFSKEQIKVIAEYYLNKK